jgi:predicted AAA+ superfamily ATPase
MVLLATDGEIFSVIDIEALNAEFINYLNYGGYPEAVLSITAQEDSARYIKSDIIDKVLLRDLPSIYGITRFFAFKFQCCSCRTSGNKLISRIRIHQRF